MRFAEVPEVEVDLRLGHLGIMLSSAYLDIMNAEPPPGASIPTLLEQMEQHLGMC